MRTTKGSWQSKQPVRIDRAQPAIFQCFTCRTSRCLEAVPTQPQTTGITFRSDCADYSALVNLPLRPGPAYCLVGTSGPHAAENGVADNGRKVPCAATASGLFTVIAGTIALSYTQIHKHKQSHSALSLERRNEDEKSLSRISGRNLPPDLR